MKLRWKLAIGALAVFLLLGVAVFVFNKTRQSDLEKYKAELRSKGEQLTFAEIAPPYDDPDDQLSAFVAAASRLRSRTSFDPALIAWTDSGVAGVRTNFSAQDSITLQQHSKRQRATGRNLNFDLVISRKSWEELTEVLELQADDLAVIRSYLQDPPTRLNGNHDSFPNHPDGYYVEKRYAAQWLGASVLSHLHSKNREAAITDLRLMFALAEMHALEPTLVNQMIRGALVALSCDVAWQVLANEVSPTEPQLKELQKTLAKLNLLDALELGMVGERNLGLQAFEFSLKNNHNFFRSLKNPNAAAPNPVEHIVAIAWRNTMASEDELFGLKCMQRYVEAAKSLKKEQAYSKTKPILASEHAELNEVLGSVRRFRYLLSSISIPSLIRTYETCARNETFRQLTLTAIAIKRYELETGKPPADLNALIPRFLAAMPIDSMVGKPLRYQLNPDGTHLLYSVGDEGKDDGGDPTPVETVDQHNVWTGRDAVWPKPAN